MMKTRILAAVILGTLVGCANDDASDRDRAAAASTCAPAIETGATTKGVQFNGIQMNGPQLQGMRLNGPTLNGMRINGRSLNGPMLQGISLNGLRINGLKMNGVNFNGPLIQGRTLNGISLQGTQFGGLPAGTRLDGAELRGELSDGSAVAIFIDAVRENPDAKNADVVLYDVSYGDAHEPLCGRDASGTPLRATAIANTWDERTGARIDSADRFTFACEGAALYKCVAAGYKPWQSASLAAYHQACTRMIRADYCGDGSSFTKDGTLIDMSDARGLQAYETMARPDFAFEAAWGPDGATCIEKTRYPLTTIPQCVRDRLADSCGASGTSVGLTNRSATNNACLR